jgi:hypothetical protein
MIDAVTDTSFGSPPSSDIAGTSRDTLPDIGAYEYPDGGYKILVPQYDKDDDNKPTKPLVAEITAVVPNPFNSTVTIRYYIESEGNVKIPIYSSAGRQLNTLVNKRHAAGSYETMWDARDKRGKQVPTGVYLIRTVHDGKVIDMKSVTLIK